MQSTRLLVVTSLSLLAGCAADGATRSSQSESYSFSNPEPLQGNIYTDRPSFGSGTRAVPIGHVQIEAGYTFSEDDGGTTQSVPNTLVRTGLTDRTELRLTTLGFVFADDAEDGVSDLMLGFRYEALQQDGLVPELALQPELMLPTGNISGSDSFNPGLLVPMAWAVNDRTGVLANVGVFAMTHDDSSETDIDAVTSVLLSRALGDSTTVFGEYVAIYPGGTTGHHSLGFGAVWLRSQNLQFDSALEFGLNDEAVDLTVTAGVSVRL